MPTKYEEAIELVRFVCADDAPIRLTLKDIERETGWSESRFRYFRRGSSASGKQIRQKTLNDNAPKVISAVKKLVGVKRGDSAAYLSLKGILGTADVTIEEWMRRHQGAYLCYRFASSEGKIQVSRLDVFNDGDRPRFRHTLEITRPHFNEGKVRIFEGDVHPVRKCAHLIQAGPEYIYHHIYSDIEVGTLTYMVGVVAALSTDGRYPFASRILAIKFASDSQAELPDKADAVGLEFSDEIEATYARSLDVVEGNRLPTIRELLSIHDRPGVVRAEIATPKQRSAPPR